MRIYYIDVNNLQIEYRDFENILNLECLYFELDEIYPNGWYEDLEEAESILCDLKDYVCQEKK